MNEPDDKEKARREKISAGMSRVRGERYWASDDASAARQAKLSKSKEFSERILPVMDEIAARMDQPTYRMIAEELNRRGIAAARGGAWSPKQVERIRPNRK